MKSFVIGYALASMGLFASPSGVLAQQPESATASVQTSQSDSLMAGFRILARPGSQGCGGIASTSWGKLDHEGVRFGAGSTVRKSPGVQLSTSSCSGRDSRLQPSSMLRRERDGKGSRFVSDWCL